MTIIPSRREEAKEDDAKGPISFAIWPDPNGVRAA